MRYPVKIICGLILFLMTLALSYNCAHNRVDGKELYKKYCLQCHQGDGSGVPGMYPPLAATQIIKGPEENLISLLIYGYKEPLEIDGRMYYQNMPAFGYLKDKEIAAILNYVRKQWANTSRKISLKDVADVRFKKYDINPID
jgi:mono/diheme cytochrome c family protein